MIYLDDFLLLGSSRDKCQFNITALKLLQFQGFAINFSSKIILGFIA